MKDIELFAPVKKPEDIENFSKHTSCRKFYVYHKKFMDNNFSYISEFIDVAKRNNCKIYINFKHNITEEDLVIIKKMIKYLKTVKIDGIFINSFAVLEAIKVYTLPFDSNIWLTEYFSVDRILLTNNDFIFCQLLLHI